jgi:hypothetical protein
MRFKLMTGEIHAGGILVHPAARAALHYFLFFAINRASSRAISIACS